MWLNGEKKMLSSIASHSFWCTENLSTEDSGVSGVSFFVSQRYQPNNTNMKGKSTATLSHFSHYLHIYSCRLSMLREIGPFGLVSEGG